MELEKVDIKRIIGPTPSGAAVLLGNDKKTFVVFIGFYEAAALIREINNEVPARPLTHELIQNICIGFDVEVTKVIISSIIENTFCATLFLRQKLAENGTEDWAGRRNEVRIDARPSDCFVLALKNSVDLFVTSDVFEQVPDVTNMAEEVEGTLSSGQMSVSGEGGESLEVEFGSIEFEIRSGEEEEGGSEDTFLDPMEEFSEDEDDEEWKA